MTRRLVICLKNDGYAASLELRKIYEVMGDAESEPGKLRVIDESGEDYLYPADWFRAIELSPALRRAVLAAV